MVGLKIVDDYLNKSFYKLGLVVGRHPGYFLIVPVLITLLGMTGYQKMHNNIDPEYLFSPINGQGKYERSIVENYFKTNYSSRFDVSRITRAGKFGRVIITAKDGNKNMLRAAVWNEIRLLDDLIQNMTVRYEDEYFTYQDICAKWISDCFQNDILNLDYLMDEVISYVVPEIYLNGDTILHAGGVADCMFFLASGTVAVYTATGKEVCHLQDGAYFGEISLVMRNSKQTATIIATEISKVYRLSRRHFEYCFMKKQNSRLYKVETGAINLTFPLMLNPRTLDLHAFPVFFGGTQVSDDGLIISVPSVQLVYFGNADSKKIETLGAAWEDAFLDLIEKIQDKENIFEHIRIARFSSRTLDHELEKNTRSVIPYFTSTFVTMALFSIVTCMMTDWVRSKPWLGLLGNLSAAMATLCAFGFCMYAGVDFIGINLAAPFLMIGIGIDDTFVMLAAWRRTSIKTPVPERMAQMLSEAAVSITITSVTDFFSFWIGIFSPFPSVTIFCIYSGAATCFLFVWHLTFFAACVAISGYCEQKNLHSVFCFKVEPLSKSQNRCWLYRAFCAGGVDPNDQDNPLDNKEHGFMVFFRDYFADFLSNGCVKFLVILIFGVYLVGAGYGITQIEEGLERRKVAKNDSYAIEFFDREDDYYREFPYRVQVIVSGKYDYSDPKIQWQIENLTQTFENTTYVSNTLYTDSWLRSFLQYMERNQDYLNISIKSQKDFSAALKELWLTPSSPLSLDVKFDDNHPDDIVAMRFLIQVVNISGTEHEKEMVRALRKICHDSPLNVTVFHPYFVFFDQFELVRPLSIQNMVIGAGIMMLVSFIFIPNILCAFWVAFSIISIEMGVIGYMALWHVNLDSISMINLIMCIGFSVDFTAHICYAYMSSPKKSSKGKMKEALYALGVPIFQGSISTILGMLALILAKNYIFAVFFKMIFLVVFLGAMHGLFLLPVLLSLFGPGACTKYEEDEDQQYSMSNIEKSLPHPYCIPHPQFTLNGGNLGGNLRLTSITPMERYNQKPYKGFGEMQMEKDLGLGTSEENSSQSSTNSKKNGQNGNVSPERRRHKETYRRNSETNMFQPNNKVNMYGEEHYKPAHRQSNEQITRFDESYDSRGQYYRRRYSPPEGREGNLVRSSSHHNMHPTYLMESRFP